MKKSGRRATSRTDKLDFTKMVVPEHLSAAQRQQVKQLQHALQNGQDVDAETCFLPLLLLLGLWGGSRAARGGLGGLGRGFSGWSGFGGLGRGFGAGSGFGFGNPGSSPGWGTGGPGGMGPFPGTNPGMTPGAPGNPNGASPWGETGRGWPFMF